MSQQDITVHRSVRRFRIKKLSMKERLQSSFDLAARQPKKLIEIIKVKLLVRVFAFLLQRLRGNKKKVTKSQRKSTWWSSRTFSVTEGSEFYEFEEDLSPLHEVKNRFQLPPTYASKLSRNKPRSRSEKSESLSSIFSSTSTVKEICSTDKETSSTDKEIIEQLRKRKEEVDLLLRLTTAGGKTHLKQPSPIDLEWDSDSEDDDSKSDSSSKFSKMSIDVLWNPIPVI